MPIDVWRHADSHGYLRIVFSGLRQGNEDIETFWGHMREAPLPTLNKDWPYGCQQNQ
jgi:hypothetical protein